MLSPETSRKQTKAIDKRKQNELAFEEYLKKCRKCFVPVIQDRRMWYPMERIIDPQILTSEEIFGRNDNPTEYKILVKQPIRNWNIEEFMLTPFCPHTSQLIILGKELPKIRIRCKFQSIRGAVEVRTLIENQKERIERRYALNQYYGVMDTLLPYLNKVKYVPQEVTTVSCLLFTFHLSQLERVPFITIIITDVVTGKNLLENNLKTYREKRRIRISFEYVIELMEQFTIDWTLYDKIPSLQFFKGYFPSFTKDVLMRMPQKNFMVMKCDIQPDELIPFVERWMTSRDTNFEGCCIGFNEYLIQERWENMKKKFTLKKWHDYPQWATYSQTIQEENWNFNILNTYNLVRQDEYEATIVMSNTFFIMAVTHLPEHEEKSRFNSNFMRDRLTSFCFYPAQTVRMFKYGDTYNRYQKCTASCEKKIPTLSL